MFVKIDGSDVETPVISTVDVDNGERVTLMIKNHQAVITGNLTNPAARKVTIEELSIDVGDAANTALDYIGISGAGFVLGDMKAVKLGNNLLLLPTGISIRDGETELAKFASNLISLGDASESSSVTLCDVGVFKVRLDNGFRYFTMESEDVPITIHSNGVSVRGQEYTRILSGSDVTLNCAGFGHHVKVKDDGLAGGPTYDLFLKAGDSISLTWRGAGYVYSNNKLTFSIPISRYILGNPTVSVTSVNGLKVIGNTGYIFNSSQDTFVTPTSYEASVSEGNHVIVTATMKSNITQAAMACGVRADILLTFS